jgi:membrane-associated phospholipid phosphatase
MNWVIRIVASASLVVALPVYASAQTADNLGYFMPPAAQLAQADEPDSSVVAAHPVGQKSPIIDSHLIDTVPPPTTYSYNPPLPWYDTDWGVAGIGVAATGLSVLFDHGINQWGNKKTSQQFKRDDIRADNVLLTLTAIFPLVTMVQSPISDPELAHASSIAFTSAAEVTVLSMGLKYVINRDRPNNDSSNGFTAHPFDAANSSFSLAAVLPFGTDTSSFPSGHTALAFAVVTPYAELYHAPELYAIPVVVGLGRVLAPDGHWVSDVVGGGFIGWLTADLTRRFFPNSDYGLMFFGDGQSMVVGFHGSF